MLLSFPVVAAVASVPAVPRGETSTQLLIGLLLLGGLGFLLCFGALFLGWLIRPRRPNPEKQAIYECGEPAAGSSWVQFDLRFYVVALVFVIFDVEIALFWPWAVVYGGGGLEASELAAVRGVALVDMLFFFGVIVVGFLYLWRFGYLDWVRSTVAQRGAPAGAGTASGAETKG